MENINLIALLFVLVPKNNLIFMYDYLCSSKADGSSYCDPSHLKNSLILVQINFDKFPINSNIFYDTARMLLLNRVFKTRRELLSVIVVLNFFRMNFILIL